MTDEEIRARALEAAVRFANCDGGPTSNRQLLSVAALYEVFIRLGMDGTEGMLKERDVPRPPTEVIRRPATHSPGSWKS